MFPSLSISRSSSRTTLHREREGREGEGEGGRVGGERRERGREKGEE